MALTKKKKIIIAVSALVLLALIVIVSVFASRKDEPEVTTIKIENRPELRQTVTASGEIRPIRYIKLTSEVQGRIQEIYVNAGDLVKWERPGAHRPDSTPIKPGSTVGRDSGINKLCRTLERRELGAAGSGGVRSIRVCSTTASYHATDSRRASPVDLAAAQRELKRVADLIESGGFAD